MSEEKKDELVEVVAPGATEETEEPEVSAHSSDPDGSFCLVFVSS